MIIGKIELDDWCQFNNDIWIRYAKEQPGLPNSNAIALVNAPLNNYKILFNGNLSFLGNIWENIYGDLFLNKNGAKNKIDNFIMRVNNIKVFA